MYVSNSIMQSFGSDCKNILESLPMFTGIFIAMHLVIDDDTSYYHEIRCHRRRYLPYLIR